MEVKGKIVNITRDILSGRLNVTFQIATEPIEELNKLSILEELDLVAKKHRKKRSLDANSYAWVLITKIANHPDVNSSKEEVYEEMLQKYGYLYQDEDGYLPMTVSAKVDMSKVEGHWKFIKTNGKFSSYLMIKGSSKYDSKEMATFIDRIVEEAKELGIETATPEEIERMKQTWQIKDSALS